MKTKIELLKGLYVLTVLCTLSFLTACGDDDNGSKGWEGLSHSYEGNKSLSLKLGETILPLGNKSVVVDATSAGQATLTLNNVVPDVQALQVNAHLNEANGVYTISGENTVNDCVISLNGTFDDGKLSLVLNREITSSVTGKWKMKVSTANGAALANVYAHIVTGHAQIDDMINSMAAPMVGQLLAKKVESMTAVFSANGMFGASWKSTGSDKETDISAYTNALSIQYCIVDGQLMIAVDKAYVELLHLLSGKLAEYGLTVETITGLLTDLGGYYAIPVDMQMAGDNALFYLSKPFLLPVVDWAAPFISPMIPDNYKGLVSTLLMLLPTAEALDFGLVFEK